MILTLAPSPLGALHLLLHSSRMHTILLNHCDTPSPNQKDVRLKIIHANTRLFVASNTSTRFWIKVSSPRATTLQLYLSWTTSSPLEPFAFLHLNSSLPLPMRTDWRKRTWHHLDMIPSFIRPWMTHSIARMNREPSLYDFQVFSTWSKSKTFFSQDVVAADPIQNPKTADFSSTIYHSNKQEKKTTPSHTILFSRVVQSRSVMLMQTFSKSLSQPPARTV